MFGPVETSMFIGNLGLIWFGHFHFGGYTQAGREWVNIKICQYLLATHLLKVINCSIVKLIFAEIRPFQQNKPIATSADTFQLGNEHTYMYLRHTVI